MNKSKLLGLSVLSASMLAMASCDDDIYTKTYDEGSGKLMLSIDINKSVKAPKTSSRYTIEDDGGKEIENLKVADLTLGITSKESGGTLYFPINDFDESMLFPAGQYKVSASWGDEADEGFGKPYVYGETDVTIKSGEDSPVGIVAELNRAIFNVSYSTAIKDFYNNKCYVELKSDCGQRAITYDIDSVGRRVYLRPDSVSVYLRVDKADEGCARIRAARIKALPKYIYKVNLDISGQPDDKGNAALNITFSDATTVDSTIVIKLSDIVVADAPTIKTVGFDDNVELEVTAGANYADDMRFEINAPGKLGKVKLTTTGYQYIPGWPESIDLLQATADQQKQLTSAGLSALGLWKNPDRMAVVDLRNVMQHIKLPLGVNEADIKFVLQVEDQTQPYASTSDEVVLAIKAKRFVPTMTLSNPTPSSIRLGVTECAVDLAYNGTYIEDNVVMQYKDENGLWLNCNSVFTDKGNGNYTVALSSLPTDGDVWLRAFYQATETSSNQLTVTRTYPVFTANYDAADIWSRYALIGLRADDGKEYVQDATLINVQLAVGNGTASTWTNYEKVGEKLRINGLTPGTTYKISVKIGKSDATSPMTFTTEAATQVPNADMEAWCYTDSESHWKLWWPWSSQNDCSWGTNNPMTTSQGSNYAYCRISGTISTSDCHGGSNAALIRTVGWGSGNTASGSINTGVLKYVDAGLLHLGSSRSSRPSGYGDREGALTTDDLDCGLAFESRPSSLTFWYKYSPKNSADKGYAEVQVLDANGHVLASQTTDLASASSYTQVTLNLQYAANCAKAAKLYIKYLSTNDRKFLEKNKNNLSAPSFGNVSDGTYLGSQLYIDDITLNY